MERLLINIRSNLNWAKIERFLGLKAFSKDDEAQFRLWTGLKVAIIPLAVLSILFVFLWIILRMNLAFFHANGFPNYVELTDAYYQFLFSTFADVGPSIAILTLILWIIGLYMAQIILRPFRLIGDYCESNTNGIKADYDPDFFTDLKLLSTFSEYFFNIIENSTKNKSLEKYDIPLKYSKIRTPVFESNFFLQFFMMSAIISGIVGVIVYVIVVDVHQELVKLSLDYLKHNKIVSYYFSQQESILFPLIIGSLIVNSTLYIILAINLYSKVSAPAFGIFATMRAFIRGDHDARVHLIGFSYVRNSCRKFNKYLDKIVREITQI